MKKKFKYAAALTAAFLMLMIPGSVYAQDKDPEDEEITETVTEEPVTEEEETTVSESKVIIIEKHELPEVPEESYGPLTPDGNLTLVDDYGSTKKSGKQFITVTSKSGHYFYIIIDRDDSGNETVHFLNQVDEADLLAIMDEDEAKAYMEGKEESAEEDKPEKEEEKPEEIKEDEAKDVKKKKPAGIIVVIILGAVIGGGAYFTFGKSKKKNAKEEYQDPDADYEEGEDYLDNLPEEYENGITETENGISKEEEE